MKKHKKILLVDNEHQTVALASSVQAMKYLERLIKEDYFDDLTVFNNRPTAQQTFVKEGLEQLNTEFPPEFEAVVLTEEKLMSIKDEILAQTKSYGYLWV